MKKDRELGALGDLCVLNEDLVCSVHLSGGIAVRELRAKGWRTRAVDDMTEMQMNPCTEQSDRQVNAIVLSLIWMLLAFSHANCAATMWKRDIQNAFRRLPAKTAHLHMMWIVWLLYTQQHTVVCHLGWLLA